MAVLEVITVHRAKEELANLDVGALIQKCRALCKFSQDLNNPCIHGCGVGTEDPWSDPTAISCTVDSHHSLCKEDHREVIKEILQTFNVKKVTDQELYAQCKTLEDKVAFLEKKMGLV